MAVYQAIIGRNEEVDLVGVAMHLPAKIDTGAFRSSIHAEDIQVVTKNGVKTLTCKLLGHPGSPIVRDYETTNFEEVEVRSSNGHAEDRYAITLKLKLANKVFDTSFSLSSRDKNLFPILIGRKALKRRYIVDVSKSAVKVDKLAKSLGFSPSDYEESQEK
ncbi:MAG: RimK/LysX family protein [bacterium]|nr:RimK/LysX family protein [bacterium]